MTLGYFDSQEAAAARYDRAAIEMGKTKLNFAHSVTVPTEAQPVSVKNPLSGRRKGGSTSFLGPVSHCVRAFATASWAAFLEGSLEFRRRHTEVCASMRGSRSGRCNAATSAASNTMVGPRSQFTWATRSLTRPVRSVGSYTDERAAAAAYDMACIEFGRAPENGTSWDEQEATVKVSTLRKPKTSIYKVPFSRQQLARDLPIANDLVVPGCALRSQPVESRHAN